MENNLNLPKSSLCFRIIPNWFTTSTGHHWHRLLLRNWTWSCVNSRNRSKSRTSLLYCWKSLICSIFSKYIRADQANQKSTLTGQQLHLSEDTGRRIWSNWSTLRKTSIRHLAANIITSPASWTTLSTTVSPSLITVRMYACVHKLGVHMCLGSLCIL